MSTWKQIKLLVGLQRKLIFSYLRLSDTRKTDARAFWRNFGFLFLLLFCFGSLLFSYGFLLYAVMVPAAKAGQGGLILGVIFLLAMLIVLVFGLFSMLSALWGARDTETLAALPLRPRAVFLSKMGSLYLGHLGLTLFITLPAMIFYALYQTPGVLFWVFGLIVVILLPVIPMILSALLSLLLMRLTALTKRRELWTVIGAVAMLVALFFLQSQLQRLSGPEGLSPEAVQQLLSDSEGLLNTVTGFFPPAAWAAGAVTLTGSSAVLCFVEYLSCALLGVLLMAFAADWLYYRVSLAQLETARGVRQAYRASHVKTRGVGAALCRRELKILFRTPVYLINGLLGVVIFPVLFMIMPLLGGSQAEEIQLLLDGISGLPPVTLALALAALISLPSVINPAVTTMVSREGRAFWLTRLIPVSLDAQIRVKAALGLGLTLFGELAMALVLWLSLGLPILPVLLGFMLAAALSVPATWAGLYPDIVRPKLNWASENEAMKMNANSLKGMALSLLVVLLAAAVSVPMALLGVALPWITAAVLAVALFGGLLFYRLSMKATAALLAASDI